MLDEIDDRSRHGHEVALQQVDPIADGTRVGVDLQRDGGGVAAMGDEVDGEGPQVALRRQARLGQHSIGRSMRDDPDDHTVAALRLLGQGERGVEPSALLQNRQGVASADLALALPLRVQAQDPLLPLAALDREAGVDQHDMAVGRLEDVG